MEPNRHLKIYDHRLVQLVQQTRDPSIATRLGVPRTTVAGWLRRAPRAVTTAARGDASLEDLRRYLVRLATRNRRLTAVLRVLFVLLRTLAPDLSRVRVTAPDKVRLLRAVERTRSVLGLRRILAVLGLSAARLHAWRNAAMACQLEDQSSCPNSSPQRLTPTEIAKIGAMVTSADYRHVPTSRLAVPAQRICVVFASPTTWLRLVVQRGWRRPRNRVHPAQPRVGIRASRPNELWHIDTTLIRLLDHSRVYLHAVIDNFSRRILAWRLLDRFDPASTVAVHVEAGQAVHGPASPPTLLADAGVENKNGSIDALIESGLLKRVLAQTEIRFSNSMIEAWWRCLKHQWLFLNPLDSLARVRTLVAFYVAEHNSRLPHSAFRGQTPDEMYFGTGDAVPDQLAEARRAARDARLAANRARQCAICA